MVKIVCCRLTDDDSNGGAAVIIAILSAAAVLQCHDGASLCAWTLAFQLCMGNLMRTLLGA